MLRVDAKRLFLDDSNGRLHWDASYDVKYKSGRQAHAHAERDGTAFASVALPSHYAAIVAVLNHVKQRIGPTWAAQHIIDWGCGTGSGLWSVCCLCEMRVTPLNLRLFQGCRSCLSEPCSNRELWRSRRSANFQINT